MSLIGIAGKKNAGKSTIAQYLKDELGYEEVSFADPVKKITEIIYNFPYNQLLGDTPEKRQWRETVKDDIWNKTPREAMQLIGTDVFRKGLDENVWIKIAWRDKIKNMIDNGVNVVISDCRFPNEMDQIRKYGGKIIVVYENDEDLIVDTPINTLIKIGPTICAHLLFIICIFTFGIMFVDQTLNREIATILLIMSICSFISSMFIFTYDRPSTKTIHASENSFQQGILPEDILIHNDKNAGSDIETSKQLLFDNIKSVLEENGLT